MVLGQAFQRADAGLPACRAEELVLWAILRE
jgi:hypothetical protein